MRRHRGQVKSFSVARLGCLQDFRPYNSKAAADTAATTAVVARSPQDEFVQLAGVSRAKPANNRTTRQQFCVRILRYSQPCSMRRGSAPNYRRPGAAKQPPPPPCGHTTMYVL